MKMSTSIEGVEMSDEEYARIEQLGAEAGIAGDEAQADLCGVALGLVPWSARTFSAAGWLALRRLARDECRRVLAERNA